MEPNVFDVVSVTSSSSHCPRSPVPLLKINPKGVYPMESNVFDVVSVAPNSSHCPLSPVSPMCLMSCLLPLVDPPKD